MDAAAQAGRRRPSEVRAEGLMRGACAVLALASALLMGLDTQTETVLLIRKKATVKDVHALWVLTAAAGAAAGYHLLHLLRCLYLGRFTHNPCRNSKALAWAFLLLDKGCAYVTFAATVAAAQACLIALDGAQALQWNKVSSKSPILLIVEHHRAVCKLSKNMFFLTEHQFIQERRKPDPEVKSIYNSIRQGEILIRAASTQTPKRTIH
ncbi:hypothetical protein TRIUR3_01326 [Triticum urartu]|uniref:CASP-like protein n=1 Tax=Triticum urartu TaxID=4572 RepID=M7YUY8_TRIUA|nr:hypothetical protein TRIUR3_01326 [Triticum urartu]